MNRNRSETFARYVGLQLKGSIIARSLTAKAVAEAIGRGDANLNRWLNGKVEIPISVVCEVCEFIGVEPSQIIQLAYDRMVFENGEPGEFSSDPFNDVGDVQEDEGNGTKREYDRAAHVRETEHPTD